MFYYTIFYYNKGKNKPLLIIREYYQKAEFL